MCTGSIAVIWLRVLPISLYYFAVSPQSVFPVSRLQGRAGVCKSSFPPSNYGSNKRGYRPVERTLLFSCSDLVHKLWGTSASSTHPR